MSIANLIGVIEAPEPKNTIPLPPNVVPITRQKPKGHKKPKPAPNN
jgi:hypothetical protein